MKTLTETEKEIVVLNAVWHMIDDMVNREMFVDPKRTTDVTLHPSTATHQRLFNLLLVDFLSKPDTKSIDLPELPKGREDHGYLFYLEGVGANPQLNPSGGSLIGQPATSFMQWLDTECTAHKVWLPSIKTELDMTVKRVQFLTICGNISKHSPLRLSRNVQKIRSILAKNGVSVDSGKAFLVLPEFYEWFHNDILNYHISTIAEFLNNIRWAIYDYLTPEYERSYVALGGDPPKYRFTYPDQCTDDVVRSMYWDLMNAIRTRPYMPRFEVTKYLKMRN